MERQFRHVEMARALVADGYKVTGLDLPEIHRLEDWRPPTWHGYARKGEYVAWLTGYGIPRGDTPEKDKPLVIAIDALDRSPLCSGSSYVVAKVNKDKAGAVTLELVKSGRGIIKHRDRATGGMIDTRGAVVVQWINEAIAKGPMVISTMIEIGRGKLADGMEFLVLEGIRPGSVDLQFGGKPSEQVRNVLKLNGYRWAPSRGVWYGPRERLPMGVVKPATATVQA